MPTPEQMSANSTAESLKKFIPPLLSQSQRRDTPARASFYHSRRRSSVTKSRLRVVRRGRVRLGLRLPRRLRVDELEVRDRRREVTRDLLGKRLLRERQQRPQRLDRLARLGQVPRGLVELRERELRERER